MAGSGDGTCEYLHMQCEILPAFSPNFLGFFFICLGSLYSIYWSGIVSMYRVVVGMFLGTHQ